MPNNVTHARRLSAKISDGHSSAASPSEKGVVLVIALIMLIVISLLAVTSMRNAASSESVAGNVRTTELATQAADIALRRCEILATGSTEVDRGATTVPTAIEYLAALPPIARATTSVAWQATATWDSTSTATYVIPSSLVGGTSTFKRPPECMIESLNGTATPTMAYIITARGFGPEVAAADANRTRPQGTEIWLQSTIEIP